MTNPLGPVGIGLSRLLTRLDKGSLTPTDEKHLIQLFDRLVSTHIPLETQQETITALIEKLSNFPCKGHYDLFIKYHSYKTPTVLKIEEVPISCLLKEWADTPEKEKLLPRIEQYIEEKIKKPQKNPLLIISTSRDIELPKCFFTHPLFASLILQTTKHFLIPKDLMFHEIRNIDLYKQIEYKPSNFHKRIVSQGRHSSTLIVSHRELEQLLRSAGFLGNSSGVCSGIAHAARPYFFGNKMSAFYTNLHNVKKILDHLKKKKIEFSSLTPHIIEQECQELGPRFYSKIRNFLGKIDIFFQSQKTIYEELLSEQTIFSKDVEKIEVFENVYTLETLTATLIDLQQMCDKSLPKLPLGFFITAPGHQIFVGYDPMEPGWTFVDSNKLIEGLFHVHDITKLILSAFYPKKALSIIVCIKKHQPSSLIQTIQTYKKSGPEYAQITQEKFNYLSDQKQIDILWLTTVNNDLENLKWQAKKIKNINMESTDGSLPFFAACSHGNLEAIKIFIENHVDINKKTQNNFHTPMVLACALKDLQIIQFLIDHGAKINEPSSTGQTPLGAACRRGFLENVQFLLDKGALIDQKALYGHTPIDIAANFGHSEIVDLLLQQGASIDQSGAEKYSTLLNAIFQEHLDVVKVLVEHNVDIECTANNQCTPLILAVEKNNIPILEYLLKKGALPNHHIKNGITPLIHACSLGHLKAIKLLLSHKALIDLPRQDGTSPILIACKQGHLDVVKYLISQGANTTLADQTGLTLLEYARSKNYQEIVDILEKK